MKNWFRFGWLTSDERKAQQMNIERVNELVDRRLGVASQKPYKRAIYSSGTVTVVLHNGDMITRTDSDYSLMDKLRACTTEEEVKDLLIEKYVAVADSKELAENIKLVENNLSVLENHPDFVVNGKKVTLKGVALAIPATIVASFIEVLEKQYDDEYIALKMFWLKLALNPLVQSREDLLSFIRLNDVRITKNGNLILYRRIVTKTGADKYLVTFVTQNYYHVKKAGDDPRQFAINKSGEGYSLIDLRKFDPQVDEVPFCNLQQMYLELPTLETNTFTSAHDKKVEIKLGAIYQIPQNKINLNNGICAAGGLHAAAVNYNYSGFGDMPVVVLVNPSKAITVPTGDAGKLRTTEMFVACVNDKPQGVHFDESALAAFDSEYHDFTLEELETAARSKSFENLSVVDEVPEVSLVDLNSIKEMLKGRIKQIV